MEISLPPKPDIPPDTTDQKAMLEYQKAMFDYQFALQVMQHTQNQEEGARSNMEKSKHDAMMTVVNNLRSS